MKIFEVALNKTYFVKIKAVNETEARHCAEFFTGNITDISDPDHRAEYNFNIEEIECVENEAFEVKELNE